MTIPALPPIHGTPVQGMADVVAAVGSAIEHVRAALSPSVGHGMESTTSGNAVTLSQKFGASLLCFEIVSCWERKRSPKEFGPTKGVSWVCEAFPVPYWDDFGQTTPPTPPPLDSSRLAPGSESSISAIAYTAHTAPEYSGKVDHYWDAFKRGHDNIPTPLWWPIEGPPFEPQREKPVSCEGSSSAAPSSSASSSNPPPPSSTPSSSGSNFPPGSESSIPFIAYTSVDSETPKHDWQGVLYPRFGKGQWVWCVYDYAAHVWRVIEPYDDIIRFKLLQPMKGCGQAKAVVIGYPCDKPPTSSSSNQSSQSSQSSQPPSSQSSTPPPSSTPSSASGCGGGQVHSLSSGKKPSASSSSSLSKALQGCLKQAVSRGITTVVDPAGIVNLQFPTVGAPVNATGWAKRCADASRFEVITYGLCGNSRPSSSSSKSVSSSTSSRKPPPSSVTSSAGSSESSSSSRSSSSSSSRSSSSRSSSGGCKSKILCDVHIDFDCDTRKLTLTKYWGHLEMRNGRPCVVCDGPETSSS